MSNLSNLTHCGLPGIDHVPFGIHACHFYRDRDELVAALVPYCVAGLRENERCLWVTASPLPAREAAQELRAAWVGVDDAIQRGALRILDFDEWYGNSGQLKGLDVVDFWLQEEERALADGYSGLRITGNTSFLAPSDWPTFMEYEQALSTCIHGRRIVTLCSYALSQCDGRQKREVMHAHHCALERVDAAWQVVSKARRHLMQSGGGSNGDSVGPGVAALQPDSAAAGPSDDRMTIAANKSYRCYFTDGNDRIQTYKQIECADDAKAALEAQELLATSRFTSAEVWQGKRFIGKWGNTGTASSGHQANATCGNEPAARV
jgi:hypothetical protein